MDAEQVYGVLNSKIKNIQVSGGGVSAYKDLSGKPQINGVTLQGNLMPEDLGIMPSDAEIDYEEQVINKPVIPTVPTVLPNPYPITFGGMLLNQTYDGSQEVNVVFPDVEILNETAGTPVGEIISYMGVAAPPNYLVCDGAEYQIEDYPYLAQHFLDNFGSVNFFGGDGDTTFAVPDLQGELLRGNSTPSAPTNTSVLYCIKYEPTYFLKVGGSEIEELEIMKREQMAPYGYFGIEWDLDELMELVSDGLWDKFAIGDYFIETTTTGEQIMWEVAGKNSYLHFGDSPSLEVNHIVCCPRDCLQTYYKYNDTDTNAGGYASSLMPENLETEANKFSSKLQGYMTTIRRLENNKGTWAWASRRIFLPSLLDLCSSNKVVDKYSGSIFNQLPLFTGGNAHITKGAGFNKSKAVRVNFWTADPAAPVTTHFCFLNNRGYMDAIAASIETPIAPLIVLST